MEKNNELFDRLKSLKDQLSFIGESYTNQIETLEKRKNIDERLDIKLKELDDLNDPTNKIIIDACGKIIETTKSTIANCIYENILTKEILKPGVVEIHLDIPGNYFKRILDIVRYFNKNEIGREKAFVELKEKRDNLLNFKKAVGNFFTDQKVVSLVKITKVKSNKF